MAYEPESVKITKIVLPFLEFGVYKMLSRQEWQGIDLHKPEIKARFDSVADCMALTLWTCVITGKANPIHIQYPRDWWEAVKERWAPKWFLARYPVQYRTHDIDVREIAKGIAMPADTRSGVVHVLHHEGGKYSLLNDND